MSYRIQVTTKARKQLKNLSRRDFLETGRIFEDLKDDPLLGKALKRDLSGQFSYRIGVYRVTYKIYKKEKIVKILTVGHRSSVYN